MAARPEKDPVLAELAEPDARQRDALLVAEQIDFYQVDAVHFDEWLATLVDERNDELVARMYRVGRVTLADSFARRAPLGRVLEIACGTGRLVELYFPHAESVVLVDSSPASLAIAAGRVGSAPSVRLVEADIFDWDGDGQLFDTIIFSAWLHHVPSSQFDAFWSKVRSFLVAGGRVFFDFPDANVGGPGRTEIPDEPVEDYGFYAPVDGISIRDHCGRRWRVVHNLWDPGELAGRLEALGWAMTALGIGLFADIVWAEAHADRRPPSD